MQFRNYLESDEPDILRLNKASEHVLSPMNTDRFKSLREMSSLLIVAEQAGSVLGFLMGFTCGTGYDSLNYQWFQNNLNSFLYIDRVVISEQARGTGIGSKFYQQAKSWAVSNSLQKLAAEIDIEPPNETSLYFHEKFGFREIAQQRLGPAKVVSLQTLDLDLNQ